jgi:hypothetical protein
LVYLATLRDFNSGTYKHHGLITAFGREEGGRALREGHEEAFRSWLNMSLSEKNDDLRDYLRSLDDPQDEVVEHWMRSAIYRSYIPDCALEMESELFCRDMETLLAVLQHEGVRRRLRSGGDARGQGSSPLA